MIKLLSLVICIAKVSVIWAKNPLLRKVLFTLSQVALTTIILTKNENRNKRLDERASERSSTN